MPPRQLATFAIWTLIALIVLGSITLFWWAGAQ